MQIVPAILTPSIDSFWDQIDKLLPYYYYFQIDILDGTYGNNKTISISDILETSNKHKKMLAKIKLDFQCITKNPENHIKSLNQIKNNLDINSVYFHYKSRPKLDLLYTQLGIDIGIAIDPDDSIEEILTIYDYKNIKNIIIMTVFPVGQGQPFLEYSLEKIEQLRNAGYRHNISLDGGISETTIPLILKREFKPNFLNIGSYFSKAENLNKNILTINKLFENV